ncbi:hypothetical protein Glove_84g82 [Diversispora epigaea]|uniref:Protein kinase domain-containing protein n=1 Tax=Diversispora epigaea TaxID=1348612 RepID=A0A397JG81_9GLOM|nr:hypothetical protein Glove_84g82 [Diversispora epigaea]
MVKMSYCPAGHSSEDFVHSDNRNLIFSRGRCSLCTKEHFIQEFKTWSSGNINIDKIIEESQTSNINRKLQWIPYDNFQNIKHIADGGRGSVYSAKLENGIKWKWDFIEQDWGYDLIGGKVALKEIKDSRYDIAEFFKVVMTINDYYSESNALYYGISKNPFTQNYIIVMEIFCDENLHNFLTKAFWDLWWEQKIDILFSIVLGLRILHTENLVHCDLHGGSILNRDLVFSIDLDSCKLENELILNANNKNNKIYGSIPYIPPEALRGNEFTRKGDIYSFGGIMYEMVTAQRPFADQAHDTYLMIDICNGVRPKVPDFMLNWIPEWYLNLMYRCWSGDPSERPTAAELVDLFSAVINAVDNNITQQLKIADENQKYTSKSQKQELFELFSHSSKLHPQSCYIGRYIHTLHGLHDLMEEIKSGKSSEWYLNLMYRCWSGDPSERPTAAELVDLFSAVINAVDNNITQQLKIADENQKYTSKSQKQELFELFSHSSKLHPQSCYIGRYIHTLHGLHDLMEEIKSGKSSDPNLLKPNESIILKSNSHNTVLNS